MVAALLDGAQEKLLFLCDQSLFLNYITHKEFMW